MKKCKICWVKKEYSSFYSHPQTKDWYLHKCKDCTKSLARKNRSKEKDKLYYSSSPKRRLKAIWWWMKARCESPNHNRYYVYWARGIKVLWDSLESFRNDMLESYIEHYNKNSHINRWTQIDRIDVNWNYCKENCRRVTPKEQANNKQIK